MRRELATPRGNRASPKVRKSPDYAAEQLRETANNPAAVVVPGLDGYAYPTGL
jgi:hypothetical protein